jgi:hypothetical protein
VQQARIDLNDSSFNIKDGATGLFGHETLAAVNNFQFTYLPPSVGPTGNVGHETLKALDQLFSQPFKPLPPSPPVTSANSLAMYVFDARWGSDLSQPCDPAVARLPFVGRAIPGLTTRNVLIQPTESSHSVAQHVAREVQLPARIAMLRICCHGNSGVLFLDLGFNVYVARNLALLKDSLYPGCAVQLHGCGVASDTPIDDKNGNVFPGTFPGSGNGLRFLPAMADAPDHQVEAAVQFQSADPKFEFRGTTVGVNPGGTYFVNRVSPWNVLPHPPHFFEL